jgi:hypothetical protein
MDVTNSLASYEGDNAPAFLPKGYYTDGYARVYASTADLKAGKVLRFVKFGEGDFSRTLTYNTFDPMV